MHRAQLLAAQQGRKILVTGESTETSKTWVNPDGTLSTSSWVAPVQARRADGTWAPIDTTLVSDAAGIHPANTTVAMTFGGAGSSQLVSVPVAAAFGLDWLAKLPAPSVSGDTATYANVVPGVNLTVTAEPSGFEFSLVLPQPLSAAQQQNLPGSFAVPVKGNVAVALTAGGGLQVTDRSSGQVMASGPAPVMFDAVDPVSGVPRHEQRLGMTATGSVGAQKVVLTTPMAFLSDPATVYPVTLDPSVSFSEFDSTYIWNVNGTSQANPGNQAHLRNGHRSNGETDRTIVQMQMGSLSGKHVISASLNLFNEYSQNCTATNTQVWPITGSYVMNTVTWAAAPSVGSLVDSKTFAYGAAGCPAQNVAYNGAGITSLVQSWADGTAPNYGVELRASNEADNNSYRQFSSKYSASGAPPRFDVTYNSYPSTTAGRYMNPYRVDAAGAWWTNSLTPQFRGAATDADGGNNRLRVELWNSARTSLVWTGDGNYVPAGTTSLVTVPAGTMVNGTTYSWRARSFDTTDASRAWSSWIDVTTDTTAPATPTISSSTYTSGAWSSSNPAGTFTFASPNSSDVVSYNYRFDNAAGGTPWVNQPAAAGASSSTTFTISDVPAGWNTLQVVANDRAGNTTSAGTFSFGNGPRLVSPADGASPQKQVLLKAQAGAGSNEVTFQYRLAEGGSWTNVPVGAGSTGAVTDANLTPITLWPVTAATVGPVVTNNDLFLDVSKLLDPAGTGASALDGTVQLRAQFANSGTNTVATSVIPTVSLDQNAFGASYATEQVGPGSVSLVTGNYSVSSTDASVASYGSDLTLSRTFNSRTPAAPGLLGPGWTTTVGVEQAGSDYTGLRDVGSSVTVTSTDGGTLTFVKKTSTGAYTGQRDAQDLKLTAGSNLGSAPGSFTLLDPDGNSTVFSVGSSWGSAASLTAVHSYPPTGITQPGTSQSTSYTYSTVAGTSVPVRLLAPVTPGVTCPAYPSTFSGTANMGCRALDLTYATVAGKAQISKATERTTDGTGTAVNVDLACFSYDSTTGRLLTAWDPRLNATLCSSSPATSDLPTAYGYDASSGRLTSITPPGLAAWNLGYDSTGRFTTAARTHNATFGSGTETSTVVYGVPIGNDTDASTGLHPDLSSSTVATWAQADLPTSGVAVFGPGDTVPSVPLTAGADLRDGTIHGLDVSGREVNTATYSGSGQAGWRIDTTEYDGQGNTIRTLDAANRDRALGRASANEITVSLPADTAAASRMLDTVSLYALNAHDSTAQTGTQLDLTDTFGPLHRVTLPDGSLAAARAHTHTDYDIGDESSHPGATSLHLPVSSWTEASVSPDPYRGTAPPGVGFDRRSSTSTYTLNAGADATGWTFRTPLQTTVSPGGSAIAITNTTVLDQATGMVKETRMPSDTAGSTAGTSTTTYYTNGTVNNAGCVNNAWYMKVCKTGPKTQPGISGLPGLPVTSTTYDWLLRPQTITQTTTDAAGSTQTRTSTTTYGNSGWSPRASTTATTSTVGTALPTVSSSYDSSTGLPWTTSATGAGTALTTTYDDFGRQYKFTDADGATSTTAYDTRGRVSTVTETLGGSTLRTTTRGYDANPPSGGTERRGLLTSSTTSGLGGAFTGSYDGGGTLTSQTFPNGIVETLTSDETGDQTSLAYSRSGTPWYTDSQNSNIHGQAITHIGLPSDQTYSYDGAGRLTQVQDSRKDSIGDCLTRQYRFSDGTTAGNNAGANSNRLSSIAYPAATDHSCQTSTGGSTVTSSYDTADRLQATGGATGLVYDAFGRITTLPAALTSVSGTGGTTVTNSYYANDLINTQAAGAVTKTWQLDASQQRFRTFTDNSTGTVITRTNHYTDASADSPSWIDEGNSTDQTQYTTGLDGNLAATTTRNSSTGATSGLQFNLSNLHGDLVTTTTAGAAAYDGTVTDNDEYGNPKGTNTSRYGWLGGKQRSTDTLGNLTLMGVRLYTPVLGRFLQTDPVPGGGANAYAYPTDPVNAFDLDGKRWCGPKCRWKKAKQWAGTHDWGTFGAGVVNLGFGGYKLAVGASGLVGGAALLWTPLAPLGVAAMAYGAWNLGTGSARVVRGYHQVKRGPQRCSSKCGVRGNGTRFIKGVLPNRLNRAPWYERWSF